MEETNVNEVQGGLVDAPHMLEQVWPEPACRPSLRWLAGKSLTNKEPDERAFRTGEAYLRQTCSFYYNRY